MAGQATKVIFNVFQQEKREALTKATLEKDKILLTFLYLYYWHIYIKLQENS